MHLAEVLSSMMGKLVGQVVAQDVAGHGDGVEATITRSKVKMHGADLGHDRSRGCRCRSFGRSGPSLIAWLQWTVESSQKTAGVLELRARVTASLTQSSIGASPLTWHMRQMSLASWPVLGQQHFARVDNDDAGDAIFGDLKVPVMELYSAFWVIRPTCVRHGAHGLRVEIAVGLAEVDHLLVDPQSVDSGHDALAVVIASRRHPTSCRPGGSWPVLEASTITSLGEWKL